MKARKIARLRRLIEAPSYPIRRLETLGDQFAAYATSWAVGRDIKVSGRGMERVSRKIDRIRDMISEMERAEERERIHRKYMKDA